MDLILFLILGTSSIFPWNFKPANEIDIGQTALALADQLHIDVAVIDYSGQIDALAELTRKMANGTKNPERRIRCLNTVLFLNEGFHVDPNISQSRRPESYSLKFLLKTKQGNCFTMPLLYVAVARRLGWPIYLVHVPDHSFVRYATPGFREQNIETTSGGGYVSDNQYAKDFRVSDAGRKSGAYLRSLTDRELIGDLVAINGIVLGQRGELSKAIARLELATKLNPRNVGAWSNLANAYKLRSAQCSQKLEELGFVPPSSVPQIKSIRRDSK